MVPFSGKSYFGYTPQYNADEHFGWTKRPVSSGEIQSFFNKRYNSVYSLEKST